MIDYFAIALTHALILLACARMLGRGDLDADEAQAKPETRPWLAGRDAPDA
ncbi:hypothetical protein [Aurantiacibacter poecillastricola]|uniref:hypothetical protein n=1 Tax=Aurantiacibacter poecillastricola TaxID=3064385 RepID=UPI00273DA3EA|nr:hypothetical protein [Aurantiacibacter sp. 219JJ12-13]MDP5260739.1 hypothetical protein [Aurantiacibacter sp. 219JJ12-13]